MLAYMKKTLDAGISRKYIDLACGRRRWDLIEWQESLTYMNPEERAAAMKAIHDSFQEALSWGPTVMPGSVGMVWGSSRSSLTNSERLRRVLSQPE